MDLIRRLCANPFVWFSYLAFCVIAGIFLNEWCHKKGVYCLLDADSWGGALYAGAIAAGFIGLVSSIHTMWTKPPEDIFTWKGRSNE